MGGTLGAGVSGYGPWGGSSGGNPAKGQAKQEPSETAPKESTGGVQGPDLARSRSTGASVETDAADQTSPNAKVSTDPPEVQKEEIKSQLTSRGYGITDKGNVYQLGGNENLRKNQADAGNSPPVNADVKGLAAEYKKLPAATGKTE